MIIISLNVYFKTGKMINVSVKQRVCVCMQCQTKTWFQFAWPCLQSWSRGSPHIHLSPSIPPSVVLFFLDFTLTIVYLIIAIAASSFFPTSTFSTPSQTHTPHTPVPQHLHLSRDSLSLMLSSALWKIEIDKEWVITVWIECGCTFGRWRLNLLGH